MIRIVDLFRPSRRTLLAGGLAAIALPAVAQSSMIGNPEAYAGGRLRARIIPGFHPPEPERLTRPLGLEARDAFLFIPASLDLSQPVPLVLALHGAGQAAADLLGQIDREAARAGVVVLSVSSRGTTWDLEGGPLGADAAFIDEALQTVFDQVAIDPARIAVLGMSDGGSYALSTGMVNGDLFTDVIAFAPVRFVAPSSQGRPRFYISAGRRDMGSSYAHQRDMARQLDGFGYPVRFHAHPGGHIVDRDGLRESLTRFVAGGVAP
ncbi:PHB depolymerase family esterase [uncultured Brevundimonas sp.]|uniref:alpha/beta hydrolase n=1 Tax=uncultured Brevundimonas sp. TaxID=213418 RepID=UPI0030EC5429|tara:strand:- start:74 stop:868 length:795 start_codon:yes stop_codon:yes gene_type:complete